MHNRLMLLFVLTHIAGLSGAAIAQTVDQRRCFALGTTGDDKIDSCTAMIKSDQETPGNLAQAFYNRGFAYVNKEQLDRAIEDFDQAIRINPNYALAFVSRARAYFVKGSVACRPAPPLCASAIAQFDRAIEDFDQAIRLSDQAIRLNPSQRYLKFSASSHLN
jgi:tetratricopeptide (TPR) repeat protein